MFRFQIETTKYIYHDQFCPPSMPAVYQRRVVYFSSSPSANDDTSTKSSNWHPDHASKVAFVSTQLLQKDAIAPINPSLSHPPTSQVINYTIECKTLPFIYIVVSPLLSASDNPLFKS